MRTLWKICAGCWHVLGIVIGLSLTILGCTYLLLWGKNAEDLV